MTALILAGAGVALGGAALSTRSDGRPETAHHLSELRMYDLVGAAAHDPAIPLPVLRARALAVEGFVRRASVRYRAAGADNLFAMPDGRKMMISSGGAAARQWVVLVRDHPLLYLRTRWAVWRATLSTPGADDCPMVIVGIDDGDPAMLVRAGLKPRMNAKDAWDEDYASSFVGGPLYSHLFHGALLIAALAIGAWRWVRGDRRLEAVASFGLGLAALAFALSFFVISIDCDYRFLYFLDVAAMALAAWVATARPPTVRVCSKSLDSR